jgi:hypothetical protein
MEPTTLTTSGIPIKYFIGIATNNKVINETPSAKAVILKALIWFIFTFLPFYPSNIKSDNGPIKDSRPQFVDIGGCSKSPFSEAAASEDRRRTLWGALRI